MTWKNKSIKNVVNLKSKIVNASLNQCKFRKL